VCFYISICFFFDEGPDGIDVNVCYVLMCVFILVDVCLGRSTGWRDLLYNLGLYSAQLSLCCVITCFNIVKYT
jgi:hypothetical protein